MKKLLSLGLVGLCVVTLIGCGNNKEEKDSSNSSDNSKNVVEKASNKSKGTDKATFDNNVLETPDYKIEFQTTEVMDGYQGSKVLVVNYLYTNKSDKDHSPTFDLALGSSFTQDADKTTETLNTGMLGHEIEEANPELTERNKMSYKDVKPNATVESAEILTLVNDSPVQVSFSYNFNDIEGTKIIEVQ